MKIKVEFEVDLSARELAILARSGEALAIPSAPSQLVTKLAVLLVKDQFEYVISRWTCVDCGETLPGFTGTEPCIECGHETEVASLRRCPDCTARAA